MNNKIREIAQKNKKEKWLKRILALLCVGVMLITMNSLKLTANTLARKPMCGLKEHTHKQKCYDGDGNLICGKIEHQHTDACYQEAPVTIEGVEIENPDLVEPDDVLDLDGSLDLDLDQSLDALPNLVSNDIPQGENTAENIPEYRLGEEARLSEIIENTGIQIDIAAITEVGVVDNDGSRAGWIESQKVDGDYIIRALRDFDEVELALVQTNVVVSVRLTDGRGPVEVNLETEKETEAGNEQPPVDGDGLGEQPVVLDGGDAKSEEEEGTGNKEQGTGMAGEDVSGVDDNTEGAQGVDLTVVPEQPGDVMQGEGQGVDLTAVPEQPKDDTQGEGQGVDLEDVFKQPVDDDDNDDEAENDDGQEVSPATEGSDSGEGGTSQGDVTDEGGSSDETSDGDEGEGVTTSSVSPDGEPASPKGEALGSDDTSSPTEGDTTDEANPDEEQPVEGDVAGETVSDDDQKPSPATEGSDSGEGGTSQGDVTDEGGSSDETSDGDEGEKETTSSVSPDGEPASPEGEALGSDDTSSPTEGDGAGETTDDGAEDEGTSSGADAPPSPEGKAFGEQPAEGDAAADETNPDEAQPVEGDGAGETTDDGTEDEGTSSGADAPPSPEGKAFGEQPAEGDAAGDETNPDETQSAEGDGVGETTDDGAEDEGTSSGADAPPSPEGKAFGEQPAEGDAAADETNPDEAEPVESDGVDEVNPDEEQPAEGDAAEGDAAGEGNSEDSTVAHIDLSGVEDYPLSLRGLMARANVTAAAAAESASTEAETAPEGEDIQTDGQAEAEAQAEELPASDWVIEYDEAVFAVAPEGDDYTVMPLVSFDTATMTVNGASLVLENCRLPEDAAAQPEEEAEAVYPAQHFEESTPGMNVVVDAPEGAFPEGTTMVVRDVEDEQTLTNIEDTVSEDFVEVTRVHAVDISFWHEGVEIEPRVPISVKMSVPEVKDEEEAVVVHVDDAGETEVVDSQGEAQNGATGVAVEMPANDQNDAPAEGTETQSFEADSFSVYAVVVAKTIETKYIDARGEAWNITVGYGKEANIPADATLRVSEVTSEAYLAQASEALESGKRITEAYFFDIAILDADGNEIQPDAPVQVNITLDEGAEAVSEAEEQFKQDAGDPAVCAVHFGEENTDVVQARETDDAVVFDAASFSVWGVVYTVDFHYTANGETFDYSIPGGDCASLRELLPALGIVADDPETEANELDGFMAAVTDVTFSAPELIEVAKVEENTAVGALRAAVGMESEYSAALTEAEREAIDARELVAPDWALFSLKPFTSNEALTVVMDNGDSFALDVTDAQIATRVMTADGITYAITLTFGPEAEIPLGAELRAREVIPGTVEYDACLYGAKQAVGVPSELGGAQQDDEEAQGEGAEASQVNYARFFDIEIWAKGEDGEEDRKIEPEAPVTVSIRLADAPEEESLTVVHFEEDNGPVVLPSGIGEDADIRFVTESFSVYGVIVDPTTERQSELDGMTVLIGRGSYYLKNNTVYWASDDYRGQYNEVNGNRRPWAIGKTNDKAQAAKYTFEYDESSNKYAIYTLNGTDKLYININHTDGQDPDINGSVNLSEYKMLLDVSQNWDGTRISRTIDNKTYYLNEHYGVNGYGFASYTDGNSDGSKLTLTFTDGDNRSGGDYMLLVKYPNATTGTDDYYIINNDASLTKVIYHEETGLVEVEKPQLWTWGGAWERGNHLYLHTEATGYTPDQLAKDFYRRYLNPKAGNAITEEPRDVDVTLKQDGNPWYYSGESEPNYQYVIDNRDDALDRTNLKIVDNRYICGGDEGDENGSTYFGVETDADGNPTRLAGNKSRGNAAEILFAHANQVYRGEYDHTVSHIDISISGDSHITVPLAFGTYYYEDANGNMQPYVVTDNTSLDLSLKDVVITPEDMKRATIEAYNENNQKLDNAFVITGYSANAHTNISTVQVRIEGRFKVADISEPFAANDPEKNGERLEKPITYVVTATKYLTFNMVDDAHGQLFEKLPDGGYEALSVSLDVDMTASFNYFDKNNECPPLQEHNKYSTWHSADHQDDTFYKDWQEGAIVWWPNTGMDFVLGGNAEKANSDIVALEITKMIVDESGKLIKPAEPMTNTMVIYRYDNPNYVDAAIAHSVRNLNVEGYSGSDYDSYFTEGSYSRYTRLRNKPIEVSTDGLGQVYDYAVKPGMYYITEKHGKDANGNDELTREFVDQEGTTWTYQGTYITTEYVRRGFGDYDNKAKYPNPMHYSKTYTEDSETYASVPEVLGNFTRLDNNEVKKNGFLEFFVYNVYTNDTTKLEVEKIWSPETDTSLPPADTEVTVELYYSIQNPGTGVWSEPQPVNGAEGFDADVNTLLTLKANNNLALNWKNKFTGLPKNIVQGGTTYEVQYTAREVSVIINGVDVTEHFKATVVRADVPGDNTTNGKVTITNEKAPLKILKKWYDRNGEEYTPAGKDNNVVITADLYRRGTTPAQYVTVTFQVKADDETGYTTLWTGLVKEDAALQFSIGAQGTSDVNTYKTSLTGAQFRSVGNKKVKYSTGRIKNDANIYELYDFTGDTVLQVQFPRKTEDKTIIGKDGIGYCIYAINEAAPTDEIVTNVTDPGITNPIVLNSANDWEVEIPSELLNPRYDYYIKPETVRETGTGSNRYAFTGPFVSTDDEGNKVISFCNQLLKDYVSLDVEKQWDPVGSAPENTTVTVKLMYALRDVDSQTSWPDAGDFTPEGYQPVEGDDKFALDEINTELTLDANGNWQGTFADLPKTVMDGGTEKEVGYAIRETSVLVNGVEMIGKYTAATVVYAKEAPDSNNAISNGKVTVTNKNETVDVNVEKNWQPVPIESDASVTVQLRRYAKITKGTIELNLTSAQTGAAIAGAVYKLYKDGAEFGTYTTDSKGRIVIPGLEAGEYQLEQVSAPEGFRKTDSPITPTFTVNGDTTELQKKVYNLTNEAVGTDGRFTLVLLDQVTGEPIQGATFKLTKDGADYTAKGASFTTDVNGRIEVTGLGEAGAYRFVETEPASNYKTPTETQSDPLNVTAYYGIQQATVTMKNLRYATGSVTLTLKNTSGEPIEGAKFSYDSVEKTTDANGQITIGNVPEGDHTFEQTDTPTEYSIRSGIITFTVPANGRTDNTAAIEVVNEAKSGDITIRLWRKQGLEKFNWEPMGTVLKHKANTPITFVVELDSQLYSNNAVWYTWDIGDADYKHDNNHAIAWHNTLTTDDTRTTDGATGAWTNGSLTNNNATYTFTFTPQTADKVYNLIMITNWDGPTIKSIGVYKNGATMDAQYTNASSNNSAPVTYAFASSAASVPAAKGASGPMSMASAPGLTPQGTGNAGSGNNGDITVGGDATLDPPTDTTYMVDSTFAPVEWVMNKTNGWTHAFEDLPKYDSEGNPYYYYVEETDFSPRYYQRKSYSADYLENGGAITITNAYEAQLVITKTVSSLPTVKSAQFTFNVTGDGLPSEGLTRNLTWPDDFTDGTKAITLTQDDGIRPGVTYTVTETGTGLDMTGSGYTRTTTVNSTDTSFAQDGSNPTGSVTVDTATHAGSIGFTNSYTPTTTSVSVAKRWNGNTNWPNGDQKLYVRMTLTATYKVYNETSKAYDTVNVNENVYLNNANTHEWSNLREYDDYTGQRIAYSVSETGLFYGNDVENLTQLLNGLGQDGAYSSATITPSAGDDPVDYLFNNTPNTTSISVTKMWLKNGENKKFTQDQEITYQLKRTDQSEPVNAGTVTANMGTAEPGKVKYIAGQDGGWQTVTISNLPKYKFVATDSTATFQQINYYVVETSTTGDTSVTYQLGSTAKDTAEEAATNNGTITICNHDADVDINVLKVDATDSSKKLPAAEFQIKKYLVVDSTADYRAYNYHDNIIATNEAYSKATTGTSGDALGKLAFQHLTAGKYMLIETQTPDGYGKVDNNDIYFTITPDGAVQWTDADGKEFSQQNNNESSKPNQVEYARATATFTVGNTPGVRLPATGGSGTTLYYIAGSALLILALALLLRRRRDEM